MMAGRRVNSGKLALLLVTNAVAVVAQQHRRVCWQQQNGASFA
jgi:hypothetical protein